MYGQPPGLQGEGLVDLCLMLMHVLAVLVCFTVAIVSQAAIITGGAGAKVQLGAPAVISVEYLGDPL